MAQLTENPLEFLHSAKSAIAAHEETKQSLAALTQQQQQTEKKLERSRKGMAERIESTINQRKGEMEASYDQQLTQIEARIKKTTAAREKARTQGVKERIETETADLVLGNQELKHALSARFKKDRVPALCRTDLYYVLFNPKGVKERLLCLLAFCLLFAALPIGLYYLIPQHRFWYLIIIYLADIVIFGGLYLRINNATKVKHAEAIREGRRIKNDMKANRKKIHALTHAIKTDANEDGYNLKEFDDELARSKQSLAEISKKKQEAQDTFENVTKNIIIDEIENVDKKEIMRLEQERSELGRQILLVGTQEQQEAMELSAAYETYLGKENMNQDRLDRLIGLLQSGQAGSVMDAVAKLQKN